MIPRTLRLERTPQPQRPAHAWLIDGDDPARWLAEIARWRIPDDRLALHVLPRSREDRAAGGLFVIASGESAPAAQPAALGFGAIADRCWLPVDGVLRPAVKTDEVSALCREASLIFHPALGLVMLPPTTALRVADLLLTPETAPKMWLAAPVIPLAHPRIESIAFRVTLSIADIFGAEKREIGSDSPEELPPAPGEPSNHPLARGLRGIEHGILSAAEWAVNHLPGGQAAGGMLDGMSRWLGEHLGGISREMALSRHKALLRLIEELKTNPEAGLRHALPLHSPALHRGTAPPTGRLGSRETEFDLRRLGGGRRGDNWEVPYDVRAQLRQRYLELAERERLLGRFRRAACIYAELLGDLHAAAAALAEGKYWQEAAIVQRDHLHNPMEAARFFTEGRMYAEALKIYEEHGAHEQLGTLHRAIGDEENARRAFRQWIEQLLARDNVLHAANVLETILGARGEALELLESSWSARPQAVLCLARSLAMRGPCGEHAEAGRFLTRIGAGPIPEGLVLPLLDVFADAQKTYPDRQIRAQAEDLGRRLLATRITHRSPDRRAQFIQKLAGLAPDDRLLGEDAHRYLEQNRAKTPPAGVHKSTSASFGEMGTADITLLNKAQLPHLGTTWHVATACRDGVFVLGTDGGIVRAVRMHFEGTSQGVEWKVSPRPAYTRNLLLSASLEGLVENLFAAVSGQGMLCEMQLPAGEGFAWEARVGLPNWVAKFPLAADYSGDHTLWILHAQEDGEMLKGYSSDGRLRGNFAIPAQPDTWDTEDFATITKPLLAAAGAELLLARGSLLHRFSGDSERHAGAMPAPITFPGAITALAKAPRWSAPHVAVALRTEVHVCWLGSHAGRCHLVISGLEAPVIGYSADGTLIVLSGESGYLFDCDSRGRSRRARFKWRYPTALAVVPGPTARSFGVVSREGWVRWLDFSPESLR